MASVLIVAFAAYLAYDTIGSRYRLQSLAGMTTLLAIGFLFSKHPSKVIYFIYFMIVACNLLLFFLFLQINWHPVVVGFCTQFTLGLVSIRWTVGRNIFHCLGSKVEALLGYSDVGSEFVYGNLLITKEAVFAFKVRKLFPLWFTIFKFRSNLNSGKTVEQYGSFYWHMEQVQLQFTKKIFPNFSN